MRPAEVPSPRPGTLSMISASLAKCGVALIIAAIAASSLATSRAFFFNSRACIFRTTFALVGQHGFGLEQPPTRIHDLQKLLAFRVVGLARGLAEGLGKPGDRVSVDRVILGQSPSGLGEVAYPLGIDDTDCHLLFA